MPRHLVPHKSGVHRIAAVALYRALLTQCRALQLPAQQDFELQNLVRNRFKEQRHVTSHRQLNVSFTAGYQAIDHLDNAVAGEQESKAYILDLLERAPARAKQVPQRRYTKKELDAQRKEESILRREERAAIPTISMWDRPLPKEKLSGKRRVPVLFNCNSIPVLRFKKPQPHSLSVYLNARIIQRQNRHDRRWRLEQELDWARHEDRWDSIVNQICQIHSVRTGSGGAKEPAWRDEVQKALSEVKRSLEEEKEKNGAMARRMQEVVDREQELFDKEQADEKAEKKRKKAQEKRARRNARDFLDRRAE